MVKEKKFEVNVTVEKIVSLIIKAKDRKDAEKKAFNWKCEAEYTESEEIKEIVDITEMEDA